MKFLQLGIGGEAKRAKIDQDDDVVQEEGSDIAYVVPGTQYSTYPYPPNIVLLH
jgi:hypothetical protein